MGGDAITTFIVFLAVTSAVMAGCVWLLSDYLAFQVMMIIATIAGGIVSGVFGIRMAMRREAAAVEAVRERQRDKEAETQKQIDAMLRGNSKIPKVKR